MDTTRLQEEFIRHCVAPERDLIKSHKMSQARLIAEWTGQEIYEVLMDLQLMNLEEINAALAAVTGVPAVDPLTESFRTLYAKKTLSLVSHRIALEQRVFPLWVQNGRLHLVMANPTDDELVRAVEKMAHYPVQRHVCLGKNILRAVVRYYNLSQDKSFEAMIRDALDEIKGKKKVEPLPSIWSEPLGQALTREIRVFPAAARDAAPRDSEVGIAQIVQRIIDNAIFLGASDIHFEPFENVIKVRFRKDGILFSQWFVPNELRTHLVNRIKVMSGIDPTISKRPQEGYIAYENVLPVGVDIRVSIVPSFFGERIVLRLLDKHRGLFNPVLLGMSADDLHLFLAKIRSPQGLILMTGPTGSGKTTTIYAALSHLNTEDKCIITIEDPIEYELKGINQIQVDPRFDMGFSDAFKSILRQNPDIVLLGEIRDPESAQVAVNASSTGHLVISTLHTNDASHAVPRLLSMGCDPHVLSNSLQLVVAQRLLRRLCPHCKRPDSLGTDRLRALDLSNDDVQGGSYFAAGGCPACNQLGYLGRIGAFEMLRPDEAIRELILQKQPGLFIFRQARQTGMKTIYEDALRLAAEGITSLDEVIRVARRD
jgi:type II secretory ATPase GspE/PulE/Tfp pilus assembly ATPase PilB-like protein